MLDPGYVQLRQLTPPIVAVTTSAGGVRNAMIANSAQRSSLVPSLPRISVYISKINFSHDLAYNSGVFAVHLLRVDQWDLIWHLGLQSRRDADKLATVAFETGSAGAPLLLDCHTAFECRVINTMDEGSSTFFLGDVVNVRERTPGPVMTSEYFRAHISAERKLAYEARLAEVQQRLEPLARSIQPGKTWMGPTLVP